MLVHAREKMFAKVVYVRTVSRGARSSSAQRMMTVRLVHKYAAKVVPTWIRKQ